MMNIKKSLLSVCLSILLMFGCFVPSINVYASSVETSSENWLQNNWNKAKSKTAGFISNAVDYTHDFLVWLTSHKSDYDISENENVNDWVNQNVSVDQNGNVIISDSVINSMRDCINNYIINDTGYRYVYSYTGSQFLQNFSNQDHFHAFLELIDNDNYYICYNPHFDYIRYVSCDSSYIYAIDSITAVLVPVYNWETTVHCIDYHWDENTSSYIVNSENDLYFPGLVARLNDSVTPGLSYNGYFLINTNTRQYLSYNSLESLKLGTEGVQEYYTSDSFNTTHITGSYNTTVTDINNSPTYSDVNNYVNSYYVDNTSYPSSNQIYNYINNYNGSGGGSGDDNGGGSGNGSNIWDFLDSIGEFIGHLISSLGEVLSGILSLLTDVIDLFIGEDGLPNVFSQLVSYYLGFLPIEFIRLIELFVVCALIIGVIKLIRGS